MSAADTRVSVSGSGRLQPADVTLCLTAPGQADGPVLTLGTHSDGDKWLSLHRPSESLLDFLSSLWPDLYSLFIAGEQRQRLQAIDIRAEQGMTDTGQWYIVPTLSHDTCDKVLCSYCSAGLA